MKDSNKPYGATCTKCGGPVKNDQSHIRSESFLGDEITFSHMNTEDCRKLEEVEG